MSLEGITICSRCHSVIVFKLKTNTRPKLLNFVCPRCNDRFIAFGSEMEFDGTEEEKVEKARVKYEKWYEEIGCNFGTPHREELYKN